MNRDISIMIKLQRNWDRVLESRDEIARSNKSIAFWEQRVAETEKELSSLEAGIKTMKSTTRQKEIELSQKDEKARKLESRKTAVKNERELAAIETENEILNRERTALEEDILAAMEKLDADIAKEAQIRADLAGISEQAEKDVEMLLERITNHQGAIEENKGLYDAGIGELSPAYRSKFQKLTESPSGKAIVRVEGETCEGCHFQIPLNFVLDAAKTDKVVSCTHCGRFIYKS